MNFTNTRYYEILGVTQDASLENIERAKDRLKFGNPDDRAPFSEWDLIDEAYNVLSNHDKRKEYDNFLRENGIEKNTSRTYGEFLENKRRLQELEESEEKIKDEENKQEIPSETSESLSQSDSEDLNSTQNKEEDEEVKEKSDGNEETPTDKEESDEKSDENNIKDIDKSVYISPFTPVKEKFKDMSFEYKLKTIAKYLGISILVGPVWAAAIAIIISKQKGKVKLQKDMNPKKITEVKMAELEAFKEYQENLDKEINKLIAEPHNNYKLEINRKKYEAQVALLQRKLEIRTNTHINNEFDLFINKLQVMSVAKQLATANKNLENVSKKIEDYDKNKTPRLAQLNKELIDKNKELISKEQQASKETYGVKRLRVKQKKLLHKRNEKGTVVRNRIVRSGKFYDGIVKAKDFMISGAHAFVPGENIDGIINKIEEDVVKVR